MIAAFASIVVIGCALVAPFDAGAAPWLVGAVMGARGYHWDEGAAPRC